MASQPVDSTKTNTCLHLYPRFFPKDAAGAPVAPAADSLTVHPHLQEGRVLPTENFHALRSAPTDLSPAMHALVRQGEVVKQQVGAGRHALQYIAVGSAALGLAVACGGHPWAGFAVAAVGLLVGFGVQSYLRHRALKRVGPNGESGNDFVKSFEAMLKEAGGVVNDPALETSRKMYDFLSRDFWSDCKHDILAPAARAASGTLRLVGAGLGKLFSAKPAANTSETSGAGETPHTVEFEGAPSGA